MNAETPLARLTRQAGNFALAGRFSAARSMLAAIRRQPGAAGEPALDEIDARVCLGEGRIAEARDALDRAIATAPANAALRLLRADTRARLDDLPGAAHDASEAVILRPQDAAPKAMLGLVLLELGNTTDALACLREAASDAPAVPAHWQGLAEALRRNGEDQAAADAFDAGIAAAPAHAGLRAAAMVLALHQHDYARAEALGTAARAAGAADACVLGLHGHALSLLARHQEAAEAYREALKLAPEDQYVRHLVRAAGMLPDGTRAPSDYLETLFDGYAGHFEQHLLGLHYRAPILLRGLLGPAPPGRTLDLGCGTGLMAVALSDLDTSDLTGIDISARMLDQAARKGLYARLVRQDIAAFLDQEQASWDTILAADVFCYFGALDAVLSAIRARLNPGGQLAFTVEELAPSADTPPWRLAGQGRFQHQASYIAACAEAVGLSLTTLLHRPLREEAGAPVPGLVIHLHRPRDHA